MFSPCHVIKEASSGVENILFNRGTRGKCLNTFQGTLDTPTRLNLPASHIGQVSKVANSRLNKTHPFLHASMASYLNPNRLTMAVATPSLVGNEFGTGNITLENKCSNSVMHALLTLCVRHTFINISVLSSLDKLLPQNRGVRHSLFRAEAPSNDELQFSPHAACSPSSSEESSFSSSSSSSEVKGSDDPMLPCSLPEHQTRCYPIQPPN
jgi:hypothetical protein